MYSPRYTLTQAMIGNLAQIEIVRQNFENFRLSPVLLASLRKTAKVSATHYSTQIEGNRLTHEEVEAVLAGKKTAGEKTRRIRSSGVLQGL